MKINLRIFKHKYFIYDWMEMENENWMEIFDFYNQK